MRFRRLPMALLLLAGCRQQDIPQMTDSQAEGAAPLLAGGDPRHPKVIELFQSQGCSSCPPANANLNRVAARDGILALSFAVTYWDQLGWKDKFASPAFTRRQWDYAKAGGRTNVYTPQMVFNGRKADVGGNSKVFDGLVRDTPPLTGGPVIDAMANKLVIGTGKVTAPATVWLVRYDPREQQVAISAGENGGRTLPHRNIVRELTNLGRWTGKEVSLTLPVSSAPVLKTAVLLQLGPGGPLLAARKF